MLIYGKLVTLVQYNCNWKVIRAGITAIRLLKKLIRFHQTWFKSSHRQIFFTINCNYWKDQIKKKKPGIAQLKNDSLLSTDGLLNEVAKAKSDDSIAT